MMQRLKVLSLLIGLLSGNAFADSLLAVRVEGEDVPALAKFYQDAFGLKEVNRLTTPSAIEIMLNFGETVEAAKANKSTQIVISKHSPSSGLDSVPHVVISVTDMAKTVAAFKAAGGKFEREPQVYSDGAFTIGFGNDPAGNRVEVIYFANRKSP
jgi:predicted enzyme related to lactoylglutathione lyase